MLPGLAGGTVRIFALLISNVNNDIAGYRHKYFHGFLWMFFLSLVLRMEIFFVFIELEIQLNLTLKPVILFKELMLFFEKERKTMELSNINKSITNIYKLSSKNKPFCCRKRLETIFNKILCIH
jgi:hypothetical protein